MSIFNSLIYQHGGQIYNEKATKTVIDNENGVAAFHNSDAGVGCT